MKYIWMLINYLGPGALGVFLISKHGLLCVGAVLMIEALFMFLYKLLNRKYNWNFNPLLGAAFATIGIIIGAALYHVSSDPAELGIAAIALASIVHAGLYLLTNTIIERIPKL